MIYFIKDSGTGSIKIGYTKSLETLKERIKALQIGNPKELTLAGVMFGDQTNEQGIHQRFKHYGLGGEWFNPGSGLLDFIKTETFYPEQHQTPRDLVVPPMAICHLIDIFETPQDQL